MAYKIAPCGGIKLNEENFQIDENGVIKVIGDGAGVTDFSGLTGKPQINGHELASGDNTLETLGIQAKGNYITVGTKIAATDITEDGTHKFMTDTEKSKLSGIAENANNYVLPNANTSAIGGVKQASAVSEAAGENVTKAEFKALLDALKAAGIMASA